MAVGPLGEDRSGAGAGPGLRIVDHQRDPTLEGPAHAVAVDADHDPLLVETDGREIDAGSGVEPVEEPRAVRVVRLRHTHQDVGIAPEGLHDRDPAVVVGIVVGPRIGERVEARPGRGPERGRPHGADRRSGGLVEHPVVVVEALEDPGSSDRPIHVGRDDDVARVDHRDVVEPDEGLARRRGREQRRLRSERRCRRSTGDRLARDRAGLAALIVELREQSRAHRRERSALERLPPRELPEVHDRRPRQGRAHSRHVSGLPVAWEEQEGQGERERQAPEGPDSATGGKPEHVHDDDPRRRAGMATACRKER